jgi:hypothetical protein
MAGSETVSKNKEETVSSPLGNSLFARAGSETVSKSKEETVSELDANYL